MSIRPQTSKPPFVKEHVLPVLLVFVIPTFSIWFFGYAEDTIDEKAYRQVHHTVRADSSLSAADQERILNYHRQYPASRILASNKPELAPIQAMFEPVRIDYAIFRWMKRIAWICLATTLATLAIVGLSVAFSFRSHAALYYALRIGWPVLRTSAAIQLIGQGTLAVALSFWVTAIFMNLYAIKLIVMAGVMAAGAVIALCSAIFTKIDDGLKVDGEIVAEADAPALWERVRGMAAKLKTAAPNQIIAGVAPSFFVTEHPVTAGAKVYQGRTLYLSLPLLKVMTVEEADAVLGHELAHFSGQDTLWSRKISPLTSRFALYLERLGTGFTAIVAHFMHLFWKLYTLSISKLSRVREFRADRVGAELVSQEALKRALVKVTCYCEYRAETDVTILNQETFDRTLALGYRLEQGYPAFVALFIRRDKSKGERVPHPFDSHPTLANRLAQFGFEVRAALDDPGIHQHVTESWHQEISTAAGIEERLWKKQLAVLEFFHRRLRRIA